MTDQAPATTKAEISPTEALLNRAWTSHSNGDDLAAEQDARKALELDSQLYDAYYLLGLIYRKRGDLPAAVQNFEKANQLLNAAGNQGNPNHFNMVRRMILSQLDFLQAEIK